MDEKKEPSDEVHEDDEYSDDEFEHSRSHPNGSTSIPSASDLGSMPQMGGSIESEP